MATTVLRSTRNADFVYPRPYHFLSSCGSDHAATGLVQVAGAFWVLTRYNPVLTVLAGNRDNGDEEEV